MTLRIESLDYNSGKWILVANIKSGERPGSFSDVRETERQVYLFETKEKFSRIYKSKRGIDLSNKEVREIVTEGLVLLKELKEREEYIIQLKTDRSKEERKVRFTHV